MNLLPLVTDAWLHAYTAHSPMPSRFGPFAADRRVAATSVDPRFTMRLDHP